jgi:divinyl chlorophyllide a 8-vinyl-reductase
MRVLLLGGTGTIGRAVLAALMAAGHQVVGFGRSHPGTLPEDAEWRIGDVTCAESVRDNAFSGEQFDAVVSCLASRTGSAADAWAIDHGAHLNVLQVARTAGVAQMVLLSAICVQKPLLPFQQAKLAFEAELQSSGLAWSIVRPTAFFKSLSGQIKRVRAGKPYLLFGDGALTACKPIGDRVLAFIWPIRHATTVSCRSEVPGLH